VTIKKKNELAAANPNEYSICNFGFWFSFLSSNAETPITTKELHVKINIDELPIIRSDIIMVVIGTTIAALKPSVTAASTLTAVTISRLGAIW